MNNQATGQVTIAPEVLVTIVELTTQEVPGVYALSPNWTRNVNRFFGSTRVGNGVEIQLVDKQVEIDIYIIVQENVSMLQLGRNLQRQVARAVTEMTGMQVKAVNVHIDDVHIPMPQATHSHDGRGAGTSIGESSAV